MKDNEIIMALERCRYHNECCYCNSVEECGSKRVLVDNCLDLINRQKAELENQSLEIDILIRKKESLRDEISALSAEVDELKKTVAGKQMIIEEISELITDTCEDCKVKLDANKVKSEAIREFAERLKTETFLAKAKGSVEHVLWIDDIDNLVKEMVGDGDA